jgi:hypothetical protein
MRRTERAPFFFPLTLVLVGGVILLNNFLLINADVVSLWPALLILIGLQVLWRGDLAPSWQAHTFGITRGSVESATLEISSAEIDVSVRALERSGRLIAGQYTARSRPRLAVRNNHASLLMRRGNTWLFSFADWDLELAHDLPWAMLMSSHLGEFNVDLRGIQLTRAHIATGIGDIKLIAPDRQVGPLFVRSTFGDIHLAIPHGVPALILVNASPLCNVISDEDDFKVDKTAKYFATRSYQRGQPALDITVGGTFGNVLLSVAD